MSFLSILVPSRNGSIYVEKLIRSILEENDFDIDLIVSFNQSSGVPNWAKEVSDSRFRYYVPERELSMAKNYEFLLQKVQSEWILLIGDDDGVRPNFTSIIKSVIEKYPLQDIHYFKRAYFYWPNITGLQLNAYVVFAEGLKSKEISLFSEFNKLLWGLIEFQNLPQAYTNTVFNRRVLDQWILSHNHHLYNEMNPDIYSSVVFSRLNNLKIMKHNSIINFVGTSKKSVGIAKKNPHEKIGERADEFISMNEKDGITTSFLIGDRLWLHGDTRIFISSCIMNLPEHLKNHEFDKKFIKVAFITLYIKQIARIVRIKNYYNNRLILKATKNYFLNQPLNIISDIKNILTSLIIVLINPVLRIILKLKIIFCLALLALKSPKKLLVIRNNRVKNTHILYRFLRLREM